MDWKKLILEIVDLVLPIVIDEILEEVDNDITEEIPHPLIERAARQRVASKIVEHLQ